METVNKRHGRINRGTSIPYGTLADASYELHKAYYYHGYKEDWMMPELPCVEIDGECVDPEEELHKKDVVRVVAEVVDGLTPREAKILRMRFGIELKCDYTLEELGLMFDVTRERIRQIEQKALRKMKHPSRVDVFKELLGVYEPTIEKETEQKKLREAWAKARARAEERRKAEAEAKIVHEQALFKQRREVEEKIYKEDLRLRAKWEEIKPMVSDVDWVAHLKTENPEMYAELKFLVGDIWGYNADKVWEMYAEKK